ncbi:hypothetical protein PR202_ga10363 [Eleusine coracana subsp. coracana]|uniref:HD domain-containing protein n=1 Tax=Eleusine coracana subsp. coracana TaxID=191504 RepID=A0AAV5C6M1_ELECO|nr:hypothetical protein PR202_ga10363 [Eleusine coracana subsp. coracana]
MAVSSRIHPLPAARGLLRASPPRILPVERASRRLAPCVRAISGGPGPGGSPVPRRPPVPADAAAVAPPSAPSSASSAIDFLTLCHRLQFCSFLNAYSVQCIKIAIVHDLAEAIVGDITPSDGIPKAEKSRREQAALDEMCEVLGGGPIADEIKELWEEYENNSSIEANLVKDFDKVEMILQALEYEKEHGKVLDEFFLSTAGKFQTEIGKSWAAEVNARRKEQCGKQK